MSKLSCIIVEDEPLAMEVLRDYIAEVPRLHLVGEFTDAVYALNALQDLKVDVVFLDIHLPKLKGLDFIRVLKDPPKIILTTAYHEYALEAFDLEVTDYLLKPIEFNRFLKAVNKLQLAKEQPEDATAFRPYRYFRVDRYNVKVFLDDILYIESLRDYVRLHTGERSLITKAQIGEMTQQLKDCHLIRIHRSFSVSRDHIDAYSGSTIRIGDQVLPIGRSYRELVRTQLA